MRIRSTGLVSGVGLPTGPGSEAPRGLGVLPDNISGEFRGEASHRRRD